MMFWYGDGMSGWGLGLMAAGVVVWWALVVLGVVGLVRYLARVDRLLVTRSVVEQVLDVLRGGVRIGAAP